MDRTMGKQRDDDTGKYTETYPHEEFLTALKQLDGSASTQKIADEVGCAYRTAYAKLNDLESNEKVFSEKIGNSKLWKLNNK